MKLNRGQADWLLHKIEAEGLRIEEEWPEGEMPEALAKGMQDFDDLYRAVYDATYGRWWWCRRHKVPSDRRRPLLQGGEPMPDASKPSENP